jgi:hypothetical protein
LPVNAAFINQADWAWVSATIDQQGRPLLLPCTGVPDALVRVPAESIVAELGAMSLIVDASVPSGKVIVARTSELALYESPLNFEIQMEYGAANLSALITAHRYVAFGVRGQLYARHPRLLTTMLGAPGDSVAWHLRGYPCVGGLKTTRRAGAHLLRFPLTGFPKSGQFRSG